MHSRALRYPASFSGERLNLLWSLSPKVAALLNFPGEESEEEWDADNNSRTVFQGHGEEYFFGLPFKEIVSHLDYIEEIMVSLKDVCLFGLLERLYAPSGMFYFSGFLQPSRGRATAHPVQGSQDRGYGAEGYRGLRC